MLKSWSMRAGWFLLCASLARANVTLLLEEPYGAFGGMNPTGHSAVYLSRVCAETPVLLRRCHAGESGVVISRYHRIGGYDWIAIPPIPYLYALDNADQVPDWTSPQEAAALRNTYRRAHLEEIVPDESDGSTPRGDWTQLVGEAYDRTIYAFGIETTEEQDDKLIQAFNSGPNRNHFHLLYRNCADFARSVLNFYYPKAIHRNFGSDLGIMTPKQAAKTLVRYSKRHRDLEFSSFAIGQVPGTIPRSTAVRGVLESLVKSKKYVLPLTSLAVLHPAVGGGLVYAWVEKSSFDPKRIAAPDGEFVLNAGSVVSELRLNDGASGAGPPGGSGAR